MEQLSSMVLLLTQKPFSQGFPKGTYESWISDFDPFNVSFELKKVSISPFNVIDVLKYSDPADLLIYFLPILQSVDTILSVC